MAKDTNGIAIGKDQLSTSATSNNRTVLFSKATGYGIYYDNNLAVSSALPQHCYKSPTTGGTYSNMQSVKYSDLQHYAYVEDIEPIVMFVDDWSWDNIDEQIQDWGDYEDFEDMRNAYISDPYGKNCNPYVFDPIRYPNDSIFEWNGSCYYLWHYIGYDDNAPQTLLTTVCDYDTLYSKSMEYITDAATLKNTWPYIIKFQNDDTYSPTDPAHDCIVKVYKPYEYLNFYRTDSSSATIQLVHINSHNPNVVISEDYGLTWTTWDGYTRTLPNYKAPRLLVSGNNPSRFNTSTSTYSRFQFTGSVYAAGNIMSLLSRDYRTFSTNLTIPSTYCFCNLFYNSASNNCLKSAPKLPATTLTTYCYYQMFYYCTGLTKSPILPAATLLNYCYYRMFYGDTSLTEITCLATSGINTNQSTGRWVQNITGYGTFYKDPNYSWGTGNSLRPSGFTQVNYSATITT